SITKGKGIDTLQTTWLPLTRELSPKVTEGENSSVLSLSEISNDQLCLLSLRQKSKIFATSPLHRGGGGMPQNPFTARFLTS
ncbi:MAG: hypothetical protein ACI39E_03745, partial [Acutalibacteraceae bacterium]